MFSLAFTGVWTPGFVGRSLEKSGSRVKCQSVRRTQVYNQHSCIALQASKWTMGPNSGSGSTTTLVPSVRYKNLKVLKRTWHSPSPAKGGMLICCGLIWHSGWFSEIAQPLCDRGIEVVSLDNVSCGRSDDVDGVRGLIKDIRDHVDDLVAALFVMRDSLPKDAPLFVLGESSGGVLACIMALRPEISTLVEGWILCAPAISVSKELLPPPFVQRAIKLVAKLVPALPVPGEEISGETWDSAFGDGISADIARKDKHVLFDVPLRIATASVMLGAMEDIERSLNERQLFMRRLLVLHNRQDKRTNFEGSQRLVRRVVTERGAALEDPGGTAHQLFQEKADVTKSVVNRILNFLGI